MKSVFAIVQHHCGSIYVADYTQYASSNAKYVGKGVMISDEAPADISSLLFDNPNRVLAMSVNFEKNQFVFKRDSGEKVSNCECMLVSEEGNNKRWLCLVELKYCKGEDKNIATNFENAIWQLRDTFVYLRDEVELFGKDEYNYYWVVSMPEHNDRIPFSAFYPLQDDLLTYKDEYNSILISDNVVVIWTGTVIILPHYS